MASPPIYIVPSHSGAKCATHTHSAGRANKSFAQARERLRVRNGVRREANAGSSYRHDLTKRDGYATRRRRRFGKENKRTKTPEGSFCARRLCARANSSSFVWSRRAECGKYSFEKRVDDYSGASRHTREPGKRARSFNQPRAPAGLEPVTRKPSSLGDPPPFPPDLSTQASFDASL
ncbi:hypothetical protein MRX96_028550 [Rhipicephalus microplus]